MKKIPEERLNYLIEDEMKAHKEYLSYGLPINKDELRHYYYLKGLRKKWYGY